MILDATCSYGRRWPRHATIRIDIRPEVHPDIVMDARNLKFPIGYFDQIYCDPPHLIRGSPINWQSIKASRARHQKYGWHDMFQRYGLWTSRKEWVAFVSDTNKEFHRCLKENGRLYYKITDRRAADSVHLEELLEGMSYFVVLEDKTTHDPRLKNESLVHWLTLRPKP